MSHSFRPDIIKYDDAAKAAVSVDAKSPFCGNSFDSVDARNKAKYSFYSRRLRPKGWSHEVHTLICSSEGIIPECSMQALLALGISRPEASSTLEKINIACIKAGYSIRKTLGHDQAKRGPMYRRPRHRPP